MANNNDEQRKREQEAAEAASAKEAAAAEKSAAEEAARPNQVAEKRVELVKTSAPEPDTVSNILDQGKGYYVGGVLVDPNGNPIEG